MQVDLSRFRQTFLDESNEGLDAMESGLLQLEQGSSDGELIHTIFRAAHSIKGGAGTFGFKDVGEVTHLLETLLDQMRSGKRAVSAEVVGTLLLAVDGVRKLLSAAAEGQAGDRAIVEVLVSRLSAVLAVKAEAAPAPVVEKTEAGGWEIRFAPHPHLLQTGNEPLRMLREIARLGPVKVQAEVSQVPALADCDPLASYLSWTIQLEAAVERAAIEDVFAWVSGDCDLSIQPLRAPAGSASAPAATSAEAASVVVPITGEAAAPEGAAANRPTADSSIRVNVDKVDALINLVGELVITQAMIKQLSQGLDSMTNERLLNGLGQLDRNTRDLQEAVMSVRMLPVGTVFSRFPRVVRDLAARLNKQVRLKTIGEATELDKGVIERIADPLNHLVRNCIDHGLETPEQRRAAGKDEQGTITLSASHQGGHIVIVVADDGRGLDRARILQKAAERGLPISENAADADVWQLIFAPGFSTAATVTDVSGRGVGMDVVKKNIQSLGGQVDLGSRPGAGTTVTIRLPLTLAILDGMSVAVGKEIFIIPLGFVVESLLPASSDIKTLGGNSRVLKVRNEYLPLFRMHDLFGVAPNPEIQRSGLVVLVESEGHKIAVEVDDLVGQQQVVIKSLETNYRRIHGISGATIMGDGRVALIVDVGALTRGLAAAA